jgi:maltooligosyltrehalose trehalohydrolase
VIAPTPGAQPAGEGCRFTVWAPSAGRVDLALLDPDTSVPMEPLGDGWYVADAAGVAPGRRYRFSLDGGDGLPDPASGRQPDGVHGASEVVDPDFPWTDLGWRGVPLEAMVLYELHVGTFTPQGTFDAIVPRLDALADLGVTALELMPIAAFPGSRNWGYDGVFPYAVQESYGGPDGLRRLVDAAHAAGIGVCLDVVYNHLGPEGNVLGRYGPYFTGRYRTPWGEAVNVDGLGSDAVRAYLIGNALRWFDEFHLDALRLDAVHAIADQSAVPFLAELAGEVDELAARLGRPLHLIAESDLNDPRMVRPRGAGGLGMAAQWSDDFHHALHWQLTGERQGYYADFAGAWALAKAYRDGFAYDGRRSRSRGRTHGASSRDIPGKRLVVYSQNHDQIGNRMAGDRLIGTAGADGARVAAAAVLLSPFVPLLFMGEEYGEQAPFPYFVSHTDPELVEAVRRGRREEFASFDWEGTPPDPQAEETFASAVLRWDAREAGGAPMLALYRDLLELRREHPALRRLDTSRVETSRSPDVLWVRRWEAGEAVLLCLHTGREDRELELPSAEPWEVVLDTAGERYGGPGAGSLHGERLRVRARSAVLLQAGRLDA